MPNLVITNDCNLSCSFCFASEYRCSAESAARMTLAEFREQVAFAGTDTVRFCGGEPTLHPDFGAMLDFALSAPARKVLIMTNGVWPDAVRASIATLPASQSNRVTFLFNVLPPQTYTREQHERVHGSLGAVDRSRVTLGVTLHRVPFDFSFALELAERYGFTTVRYSVAAPNITDPGSWHLNPERDFPALAGVVFRLVTDARARGLRVQSDCGYMPPCMFTDEQLTELRRIPDAIEFRCHGPIDIGPGGEAWRCYGLYADMRVHTGAYPNSQVLADDFRARTAELDDRFLFDACAECDFRARGECGGGCYAFRIARSLAGRARAASVELDDRGLLTTVPTIDADNAKWFEHDGRTKWMMRDGDTWSRIGANDLEVRVLGHCNGRDTVAAIIETIDTQRSAEILRAVRRFFERGAIHLDPGTDTEP